MLGEISDVPRGEFVVGTVRGEVDEGIDRGDEEGIERGEKCVVAVVSLSETTAASSSMPITITFVKVGVLF